MKIQKYKFKCIRENLVYIIKVLNDDEDEVKNDELESSTWRCERSWWSFAQRVSEEAFSLVWASSWRWLWITASMFNAQMQYYIQIYKYILTVKSDSQSEISRDVSRQFEIASRLLSTSINNCICHRQRSIFYS